MVSVGILSYLQPISEDLRILATGGMRIGTSVEVFQGHIDSDFRRDPVVVDSLWAPRSSVQVYEMVSDGRLQEIYESAGVPLTALCLTQSQIVEFASTYREWFNDKGPGTFLLFSEKHFGEDQFFVAYVKVENSGKLGIYQYRLPYSVSFDGSRRRRFVLPKF